MRALETATPLLALDDLAFSYEGRERPAVDGVSFSVAPGGLLGLLGPNGSGKSTLLKLVSGLLKPSRGAVRLGGAALARQSRRELARQVAVVPQQFSLPFAFRVREVVALGRTPYVRAWRGESAADRRAVARALDLTDTAALAERPFDELSGGERQRVVLALALAQEPTLLLLDEATAHLDVQHQLDALRLVQRLNVETGLTVVAAMHDLNLAALFCQRLVLLSQGRLVADGLPAAVLRPDLLAAVFGVQAQVQPHPTRAVPHVVLLPEE